MRNNTIVKGAVGAMLFGGTLGAASTAEAGLAFTNEGASPTFNYAYNASSYANIANDSSFSALSFVSDDITVAWSATTASGFSATVTSSNSLYQVNTRRSFSVTGTQEVMLSWSGSQAITFGLASGSGFIDVPGLGAGWDTGASGSVTFGVTGSVTVILGAGDYQIFSKLDGGGIAGTSSFNFAVVPAPGALGVLGLAGMVGSRRRI